MKKLITILSIALLSGCMNLYTRCPFTDKKIENVYQSTEFMFPFSCVVMFPQVMSPGSDGLYWENVITIPAGIVCFGDTACELVLDTVFYPADYFIVKSRTE